MRKSKKKTESQVELGVETQAVETQTTETQAPETPAPETETITAETETNISLNKHSLIIFQKGFYVREKISQFQYAGMSFNEQENTIVFRFVNQKQKQFCYKIMHRGNSGLIFGGAFFKAHFKESPIGKYTPVLGHMKNNMKYYSIKL